MSWPKLPLDQLGYVSRGRSRHRPRNDPSLYGGPYPFIQTGDVKHANFRICEHTETYSEAGLAQSRLWPKDTLCITIAANIADTALLGYEACFPDSVIGFIADREKADPRFVKYYFDIIQRELQMVSHGATQDNLSQGKLLTFGIACPPVNIQRQVADVLSAYDDLIATNQRRIALLEDAARRLYREWFVHLRFPGHESVPVKDAVPEGWAIRNLFDVCDVDYGFPFKADQFNTDGIGMPAIRIRDIPDVSTSTYTAEEVDSSYIVKRGDFLIGMDGIFHMNFWVGEDALLVQRVCRIRPKLESLRAYIGLALRAPIKAFEATIQGATVAHLGAKHLKSIDFLVPAAMDEQLDYLNRALWQQIQLREMNRRLAHARDLLLPKLMSGQLDVSGIRLPEEVAA